VKEKSFNKRAVVCTSEAQYKKAHLGTLEAIDGLEASISAARLHLNGISGSTRRDSDVLEPKFC
jgi:hypothetical protein